MNTRAIAFAVKSYFMFAWVYFTNLPEEKRRPEALQNSTGDFPVFPHSREDKGWCTLIQMQLKLTGSQPASQLMDGWL